MRLLLFFSICFTLVGAGSTYTVKSGGEGTYTTIQACADAMGAGDTCTVYAGTYNESVTVTSGTPGNFKTFNVNGTDAVYVKSFTLNSWVKVIGFHIQNPSSPTTRCVSVAGGASNVYLTDNVISQCGNGAQVWVDNGTGASYVYIQGNTFSYACGTPAAPDNCNSINVFGDHFLIENNDFSHNLFSVLVSATYTVIRNNTFHDTFQSECTSDPGCHMDFIFSEPGSTLPARYNLWESNIGRNSTGGDSKAFLAQADSCAGNCYNVIIRFNTVAHLGGAGITDNNSQHEEVAGFSYVKAYNNTWVDLNSTAPLYQITHNFSYNSTYGAVINDLFYYPFALVDFNPYATDSSTVDTFVGRNNLAYCTASPCNVRSKVYGQGSFTSEPGNIVADPKFVNYASNDFRLASGSPAIAAGTYLTTVAAGDSGSGTSLVVNDASYFQDGLGLTGVNPDCVSVTTVTNHICVTAVNYSTNTLTLASGTTRSAGDSVWLYSDSTGTQRLTGTAPNIGAMGAAPEPPATTKVKGRSRGSIR